MDNKKVTQALATLSAEIEKLQTATGLADYLAWQARFYTYSPANVLLIRVQRSTATQVAGFRRWLELGRCVRKGEKGILILAPVFRPTSEDEDPNDRERRPVTYQAAYVFDVAQTEPLPGHAGVTPNRPDIAVPVLTGDGGREFYTILLAVADAERIAVTHAADIAVSPDCMGYYLPRERRIWVREAAPLQMVKTLAHELAHHFGCHDESNPNNEAMAEGAAYVVLQAFGLDSAARSVPYIVGWDARQPGAYKTALAGIQRTAKILIERASQAAGKPGALAFAA